MESAIDMYWFHNDTPSVVTQILRDLDKKRKLAIVLELTEPAFFLPETSGNRPVVLRGRCTLIVKRPLKIKQVVVALDGFSYIRWPNRIREMGSIVNCPLTLFNSKKDSKTQFQYQAKEPEKPITEVEAPQKKFKTLRKMIDQLHLRSPRTDLDVNSKCFHPGKYSYEFEMILHSDLPESTFVEGTIVRYHLKASVQCHSMLRGMYKSTEVDAVRCPADAYVEDSVGGNWSLHVDGVLHVDVTLPRKGIALEDCLPVLLKYKGYNDTKFRKLHVFLVEDVRYYMRDGTRAGKAPYKRRLLHETRNNDLRPEVHWQPGGKLSEEELDIFEAKSTSFPMSCNNCDSPDGDSLPPSQTIDIDLKLNMPKCKSHRDAPDCRIMHYDTKLRSVEVTHFLEFQVYVFVNGSPATKPFETLVPLTLRSCYANAGNTILPGYFEERLPVYSSLASDAPVSTPDHDHDC
ncbi:putative arrestin-related trafficking adapter C839.02 [Aspergillus udagawae]|uniref:Putative arrestin-related trafficking adapter C839.02 n=1 Tax=Aspergillus udagawae TaxID=91492 RepID=A0A8H3RH33_9EURO|nr:putative arrestin-related trafficking adapter C839.02 [Aspergillus udagawae]